MVHIPNNWIQTNQELLLFILESKVLKGKRDLCSLEKILSELKNIQDENNTTQYQTEEIRSVFQEMEYYSLVQLKKSSGVTYITPTDDYFSLKSTLTKNISIPKLTSQIQEISETNTNDTNFSLSALQYVYHDITNNTSPSAEFIVDLPKLIDTSIKILHDERSEWTQKSMISSCLGYLLISNQTNSKDYVEELFLFSFILKHIDIQSHYLLVAHWDYPNISLKKILTNSYLNAKIVLSDTERRNLLHLLGIPKLIQYPAQPAELRKALGLIAYLMGEVYQAVPNKKTLDYLENKLISLGEYDEIHRILNVAKGELVPKSEDVEDDDILTDEEYELLLNGDF